jgi:hypothetical protein
VDVVAVARFLETMHSADIDEPDPKTADATDADLRRHDELIVRTD